MKTKELTLQFHTPAFLGDAHQSSRWRTPPFKAQLRQWWRVAYAMQKQYAVRVDEMREREGRLFGNPGNDKGGTDNIAARKSQVRIWLSSWEPGTLKDWPNTDTPVSHPNVPRPVGAQLYMGYGPLTYAQRATALKANAAIQAKENVKLSIAYPDAEAEIIETALHLMNLYGTVGGRSRNAWGSYSLAGLGSDTRLNWNRSLRECLKLDWPHTIAADDKGALIWQTQPHKDWRTLMKTLAQIKIELRTQFGMREGPTATPEDRHWLSYPITNHDVQGWKRSNLRLPNQLRFKVRPTSNGELVGVIFHMPHLPPSEFNPDGQNLSRIWEKAYAHLDNTPACPLTRIKA